MFGRKALQREIEHYKRACVEKNATIERLRNACREAASFYGQGGIFPIDGEMSCRLRAEANRGLAVHHREERARSAYNEPKQNGEAK